MSPARGAATVAVLVLLYRLWHGRRSKSNDSPNKSDPDDTIEETDSTSVVDPPNSSSFPSVEYEVFLSFRGPDTRHQITDILYRFLIHTKIHTFKDDDELRKGGGIWSSLVRAIDQSKVYVPIISSSYAHSKWCLKELAEIVDRQKEDSRRIILPIFYMVDPRDVRHQDGPYRDAFQKHEKNFDEMTVQRWRNALTEVGALKGWHVKSNDEQGSIADEVYTDIWSHLSRDNYALDTDELVGIDDHIETVVDKLSLDTLNVTVVGIHGIGGIGKTTIAKAVYNKISSRFDRCCFIENVRETQEQKDGIVVLQKSIISSILRMDSVGFIDDNGGRKMIRERVSRMRVLMILDDVDEKFRFEDIVGRSKDFVSGSRFIVTSRNWKVLSTLNENQCKLYEVDSMSHPHSLELFSKHAFRKNHPPPAYKSLADDIVSSTGGLPLTLKVIGSLLFKEDTTVWEEKLKQLQGMPEFQVMERLKISYDTLTYEAQQIFLDIACLFIGKNKDRPSYMWSDCDFYPTSNINILLQRSMLKVGDRDEFQMHDQLRDMGREIVRREDIERAWRRSRIRSAKAGRELLINKKGSSQVKALKVDSTIGMDELKSECFLNLSELRYFEAKSTTLAGDFTNLLPNLRWLELVRNEYRETDLSFTGLNMDHLVTLALPKSNLTNDWRGWSQIKMAKRLKVMDLSECSKLTRLPYFPKNLEILDLKKFKGDDELQELDIGELKKLQALDLENGKISNIIGGTFGMLKGLRELRLANLSCENLSDVLVDVYQLPSLKTLRTHGATKVEFRPPVSLKELSTSSRVSNLGELLELEVLSVYDCDDGFDIPSSPILDSNNEEYSDAWWKVSKLKSLSIKRTKINDRTSTSLLPSSLTFLKIAACPEWGWIPSLHNLESLTRIEISKCTTLCDHMDGLEGLKSLRSLEIRSVEGLTRIRGLGDLLSSVDCKLETLIIMECPDLTEMLQFELDSRIVIRSLQLLIIVECPVLEAGPLVRGLSKFPMLLELLLAGVKITSNYNDDGAVRLEELEGLGSLEKLYELGLLLPPSIERIPSLSKLPKLVTVSIVGPGLREIEGIGELSCLEELDVANCSALERLWPADQQLSGMGKLKEIDIRNCGSLTVDQLSALRTDLPNVSIKWPDEPYEFDGSDFSIDGDDDEEEDEDEDEDGVDE